MKGRTLLTIAPFGIFVPSHAAHNHRDKTPIAVLSAGFVLAALVSVTVGFVLEWSTDPEEGERTEAVTPDVTEPGEGTVILSAPDAGSSEP